MRIKNGSEKHLTQFLNCNMYNVKNLGLKTQNLFFIILAVF